MFVYTKLEDIVFNSNSNYSSLVIITGYITPSYIKRIVDKFKGSVDIFVGMGDGKFKKSTYFSIEAIIKEVNDKRLNVFYTNFDVHAKIYIWKSDNGTKKIFIGSANFSDSMTKDYKEVLGEIDSAEVFSYYNYIRTNSTPFEKVDKNLIKHQNYNISAEAHTEPILLGDDGALLSLLTSTKGQPNVYGFVANKYDVHGGGGLNWGFSNALPKPNDAYIPIPMALVEQNGSIFKTTKKVIKAVWDDGTEMLMLLEGNNVAKDGHIYPKQISSYNNKSILGKYLRKRIGKKIGLDLVIPDSVTKADLKADGASQSATKKYRKYMITKSMLKRYGRYDIEIRNMGDDIYYFDFSV